jgi:glycosyltransferase involved in cell wall biosynthesis
MRAVESALRQTYANIEVVVVVDGPDEATVKALRGIVDPRLRVIALPKNEGGSNARNAGVQAARGDWIAFLDDDDEWLSEKTATQVRAALQARCPEPIVSCRFSARTVSGEFTRPSRTPRKSEPMSEYLLVREGLRHTEGFVATPTILALRTTLIRVPFRAGLRRHQDWDWMLRVTEDPSVEVLFCPETLVICHMEHEASVSRKGDWENSMEWLQLVKPLVTKRAYASFVTCHVAWQAATQNAWRVFFPLLIDAAANGTLRVGDIVRYMSFWFVPRLVRRRMQSVLT